MRITDFDIYKDLLMDKSGLVITPDKSYLLDSRLNPVARKWGYPSLEGMTQALQGVPDKDLVNDIIEAMTTNETSFFRDTRPFDTMKNFVIPYMAEKRASKRSFRLWSAAASSGQEAYSLAMIFTQLQASILKGFRFDIWATDISNEILEQARSGLYSQFEVQRGLPVDMLVSFFEQIDNKWQIKDEIKKMVKYDLFNLLDPMNSIGKFDIIFCRNVLIYFNEETKRIVLDNMAKQLEDDGVLFLGGAESVIGITDSFAPIPGERGVYAKPGSVHVAKEAPKPAPSAFGASGAAGA